VAWLAWLTQTFWYAASTRPRSVPGRRPGVPPLAGSQLRASDAERTAVADALAQHFSDGRLDAVELDERVQRALSAKTRGDLAGLLSDLPNLDPDEPAPRRARRHDLPSFALWAALLLGLGLLPTRIAPFGFFLFVGCAIALRRRRRARQWVLWHDHLHFHGIAHWHGLKGPVVYESGLPPGRTNPPYTP
jgi:hypothetical protein